MPATRTAIRAVLLAAIAAVAGCGSPEPITKPADPANPPPMPGGPPARPPATK